MAEVLNAPSTHEGDYFSSSPLYHQPPTQSHLLVDTYTQSRTPSPIPESGYTPSAINTPSQNHSSSTSLASSPEETYLPLSRSSSFHTTAPSSVSLDAENSKPSLDDEEISFPSYDDTFSKDLGPSHTDSRHHHPNSVPPTPESESIISESDPDIVLNPVADDTAVRDEPSRQVDYLSHDWREEDIWSSWKHIVSRRKVYGERSRLENASWRTWAKQRGNLHTVSPETLNWLKDCDVTWLYGPLQEGPAHCRSSSLNSSRLSKSSSFLSKKPILKKRSVSEEMLQKSLSSSSLVKQAAAAVQAQRNYGLRTDTRASAPNLRRSMSELATPSTPFHHPDLSSHMPSSTSSGLRSPDASGKRHIRFDNNVEQCIAVDFKEGGIEEEESNPSWAQALSDTDSDDELPTIKTKPRKRANTPGSSRNSFSNESKGIAKLPSTTLKFHQEDPQASHHSSFNGGWRSPGLSPSPSQETLRPSHRQSANFFFNEQDGEDDDMSWEPSGAFSNTRKDGYFGATNGQHESASQNGEEGVPKGMRRTASGMLMPFDENEDQDMSSNGIFGRVVDTVNTARDICYVLYNVGWRK